jgi:hypothetical protein
MTKPKPVYTAEELRKFDSLTLRLSSRDQVARIEARFDVQKFEKEHGKAKCEAMFAVLKARDAKQEKARGRTRT